MNLVVFALAGKKYAFNICQVREVIRIRTITPVPETADLIAGIIDLRGHVIPILNLRRKFGLEVLPFKRSNRLIITSVSGQSIGIIVDEVPGVMTLDEAQVEPPEDILREAEYLTGVAKAGTELILVADVEKILSDEEKAGLAAAHQKVRTGQPAGR